MQWVWTLRHQSMRNSIDCVDIIVGAILRWRYLGVVVHIRYLLQLHLFHGSSAADKTAGELPGDDDEEEQEKRHEWQREVVRLHEVREEKREEQRALKSELESVCAFHIYKANCIITKNALVKLKSVIMNET